ncbi:MAG: hypothetical protein K2G40_05245 [Muribaculaceae bacterium]|nr:hypothetical protein [Muribaculaceae bacterium]
MIEFKLFQHKPIRTIVSVIISCVCSLQLSAQVNVQSDPKDFETELNTPEIPAKRSRIVQERMQQIAQGLIESGFNVELMRDDQVVTATISLNSLFEPNGWTLVPSSTKLLQPFTKFTRQNGEYKLLLCVHSDNTGSESYRTWICEQRVLSLYDYFDTHGNSSGMIYGYPMGNDQPLVKDNSAKNRALNRRLEIYIVPGPDFIKK